MIRDIFYSIIHFFNYSSMWLIVAVVVVFSVGWGLLEYWLRRNTKLYMIVNAIMLALTLFSTLVLHCYSEEQMPGRIFH